MTLVTGIIKMNLVREGYLPNFPYHLISDAEMCDAFLHLDDHSQVDGFFADYYPCLDESLREPYDAFVNGMMYHLKRKKASLDYVLPDWVLSYMLGAPISVNSPKRDIHDLLVPLGIDNIDDDFLPVASEACLKISKQWVKKLSATKYPMRPPTLFGESHVLKYLRLQSINV